MTSRFCPTCGRANLPPEASAHMTGEFTVPAGAAGDEAPAVPTPMPYAGSDRCSWCGKPATQVKKLITGPGVQICDECVNFCMLILRDEGVM
jgi:ClpX C4-type zinc finger